MFPMKIFAPVLTALLGLGLAGAVTPQDRGDDGPDLPRKTEKARPAPKKKERERKEADKAEPDPATDLRETYAILRRLRSQGGPAIGERPREWAERASRLYRVGVQAYQEGDLPQARAYSAAARDLARAIELTGRAVLSEQPDDDLPPPPPVGVPVERVRKRLADVPDLPPPLLDDDGDRPALPRSARGRLAPVPPRPAAAPAAPRAAAAPRAPMAIPAAPAGPEDAERRIQRLEEELDQLQKRLDEAKANPDQKKSLWQYQARLQNLNSASQARADLRRAYERIREARAQSNRGPESRFYLDAARDLYNAARRDAEAGRNDRASELARAAEALTLVPRHLADLPPGANRIPLLPPAALRLPRGPVGVPPRPGPLFRERKAPEREGEQPKPAEPKSDASKPDDAQAENAGEKPFAGIGVALSVEDGKTFVNQILPGGSADKDGRLQIGDQLVAVESDEGKTINLDDKELAEIAQLIRGPAGSKIRLVVIPKGSEDRKRYTVTRQTIDLGQIDLGAGVPPGRPREKNADKEDQPKPEEKPALPRGEREGAELPPFLPD